MSNQNTVRCLVCSKDLSHVTGVLCPVCGFMIAEILGDPQAFIEDNRSEIENHRNAFMKTVNIGTKFDYWEIKNGKFIEAHSDQDAFGTLFELYDKTTWLPRHFDHLTDRSELDATIYIQRESESEEREIMIPNLEKADYYQLGIAVDADFHFRILIRDQNGKLSESESQQLF